MSEQFPSSTDNSMQSENLSVSQPQLSSAPPANEVRIRVIYARLCYVAAALLMSSLTYYFFVLRMPGRIQVVTIPLIVFACLVTVAYYLVQTRYTIANRKDLFYHLRKLLPFVILISFFICVLIGTSLFVISLFYVDWASWEALIMSLTIIIAFLIVLFFSFKKARSIAKQIPVVPGKKLGWIVLILLILPVCATLLVNYLILEKQNQSYVNSKLWTFVPASSTYFLGSTNRVDGIWYLDERYHVAYYDFDQRRNTFVSQTSYNNKSGQLESHQIDIYGDYFIFRLIPLSEDEDEKAEYIILNNKKTNAVKAVVPRPSQLYGYYDRYTVLPSDSYTLPSYNSYRQGKDKDTVLAEIPVSIKQGRNSYYQYVEIDLVSGKVIESDKQSYDDAQRYYGIPSNHPRGGSQRYDIDYVANNYYIIDNETGAKVKQPSRAWSCQISGGEKYLICDTEHLQWWTDKSKKGFVYWSLADLMK